jgi:hypothetical protein
MTTKLQNLRKSLFLQLVAVSFMLAPLGNIMISFFGTGRTDWTHPQVFILWMKTIPSFDWFWLILTFVTGVLLLIQHKTSWAMAIFNLGLIMTVTVYRWFTTGELIDVDYSYFQAQTAVSVLVTAMGFGVLFYFRFPYLDRRTSWFSSYALPRFEIKTVVTLMGQDVFEGRTSNLSMSGALVELDKPLGASAKMKVIDMIFPEIRNLKVECQIISHRETQVRLKFRGLKGEPRQLLQKWIDGKN